MTLAKTVRNTPWMPARMTAARVALALLPAAIAACATPPKPRELESYDLLRQTSNLQEASKKSPSSTILGATLSRPGQEEAS